MGEFWTVYTLPFLVGLLTSFIFWLIFTYIIVPRVHISPKISKTRRKDNGKWTYRVKIDNSSRRTVIDLEFFVRLRVKGLDTEYVDSYQVDYLTIHDKRIPWLKYKNIQGRRGIVITLFDNNFEEFQLPHYPAEIQQKIKDGLLTLEDLLPEDRDSSLQFIVFGFDRISCTRKMFQRTYKVQDIEEALFDEKSLKTI